MIVLTWCRNSLPRHHRTQSLYFHLFSARFGHMHGQASSQMFSRLIHVLNPSLTFSRGFFPIPQSRNQQAGSLLLVIILHRIPRKTKTQNAPLVHQVNHLPLSCGPYGTSRHSSSPNQSLCRGPVGWRDQLHTLSGMQLVGSEGVQNDGKSETCAANHSEQ